MTDTVITLKERHARKMARMDQALVEIDALLQAYARQHGGRFIRYGSTATGRMRQHSDVDIIADFDDERVESAASYAEDICFDRQMLPDVRAVTYASPQLLARAVEEGTVLS